MAQNTGTNKLSLFSLTGYLQLLQKKNLFKNAYRKYWFWFDEQTCCLKYYRSQETYTLGVNEPLGTIDLRYAKVTPGISTSSAANNVIMVNAGGQTHVMAASDADEAHSWITSLQEKRGDYIKQTAAMEETALEQEKDRKLLRPLNKPVGALAETTDNNEPTSVRKIVRSKLSRGSMALELIPPVPDCQRRATFNPLGHSDKLLSQTEEENPSEEDYINPATPLTPQGRRVIELEAACINYQSQVDRLQKDVARLKEQVENRDLAIQELNMELEQAREETAKMNKPHRELKLEINSLRDIIEQYKRSLKSMDDEVELQKLNQKEHTKKISSEKQKVIEMEKEMNTVKSKYIKLLSTKFKVDVPNPTLRQDETEDLELTRYTNELLALVAQEGGVNLYRGSFEDEYGEIHEWQSDLVTHHYLCRQLYLHYNQQDLVSHNSDWEEFLSQVKRTRKPYLELISNDRSKLRALLRKGVPIQFRLIVWTSLIFTQVGRTKESLDAECKGSYYWTLVNSEEKSDNEKQIKIDLHRTLPNNRHFKLNGSGIPKLENILIAFSKHNKEIGYCQGMNMVAALGLLFLDEETVFWFMVCITEKLLPGYYYTPDLLGAQADQLLLKDLVAEKLPRLNVHLGNSGIDVTFVTLNWFLTLFVDSMPTESALRIMDCFLLEGIKFIFRTSLSILRISQTMILQKQDSFVLFQYVKELAKHIFDMESVFQEFPKLDPFPNRATLSSRHHQHFVKVKAQWDKKGAEKAKKEQQRAAKVKSVLLSSSFRAKDTPPVSPQQRVVWDCGTVCRPGEVWLCGGEGNLGVVSSREGDCTLSIPSCRILPRVICAHHLPMLDIMLVGTIDFNLAAIDCSTKAEKWRHTLTDSVLAITGSEEKIFAALANGLVAMLQDVTASSAPEPRILRVGPTTVNSMVLSQQYLWCGCGKSITVMSTESLEPVESLVTPERVNKLVASEVGVWVSFRSSSLLTLYDTKHYVVLLSIDYCTALPLQHQFPEEEVKQTHHRITSLMLTGDKLWLGTGGGRILLFTYAANVPDTEAAIRNLAKHRVSDSEATPTSKSPEGGGLLTNVGVADKTVPTTPDEEKWVTIDAVESVPDPNPSVPTHYRRRKTQFGRTLRNKSHRPQKKKDTPDIYHLEFLHSSEVITEACDSVRVLVAFKGADEANFAVSCLNTVKTDWKKGVQLWVCPEDDSPPQWKFHTLSPSLMETTSLRPPTESSGTTL